PHQLAALTAMAQAALGKDWSEPVRVKTLAIFTHGWEEGIRALVNEEADRYSNSKVTSMAGYGTQLVWARQLAENLADRPTVVTYACRAAGDTDAYQNHTLKRSFNKFETIAFSRAEMGGGVPFGVRLREGVEQGLVARELKKQ